MTEELAWFTFTMGLLTTMGAILSACVKPREILLPSFTAILLTATAAVVWLDTARVKDFAALVGLGTIAVSVAKYVYDKHEDERRRLASEREKRNDRLLAEWQTFVANPTLIPAIHLLEFDGDQLKKLGQPLSLDEYKEWKNPLDQVFDFLQRLAYAVQCRDLERSAVRHAVGWYYGRIRELPHVRDYCLANGYQGIVEFADRNRDLKS